MAINSSISDMPWLGQPADLATSLLKGSQVGSSLVSAYLRARELRDQEEREKVLLPLRQQELQARVANQALDMQIQQEKLSLALKLKANDAEGWRRASEVNDWVDPNQVGPIYKSGPFSPEFTRFLEGRQQAAEMFSAKGAATTARLEALQDTLRSRETIAELGAKTRIDVAESQAAAAKERLDAAIAAKVELAKTSAEAKFETEILKGEYRTLLGREQINARAEMLDKQIEAKAELANTNNSARADLEKLKQERLVLEKGKTVKELEFVNRHLEGYVRNTGATHAVATAALQKLYRESFGTSGTDSVTGTPKDPLGLFPR